MSCVGFADGDSTVRNLHMSKLVCAANTACHGIECSKTNPGQSPRHCTLRSATRIVRSSNSDCYTRADSRNKHGIRSAIVHPSRHKKIIRGGVVQLQWSDINTDREWKKHSKTSCHGFAEKNVISRDLEASKMECMRNRLCYGIECERTYEPNPKDCTLRAEVKLSPILTFTPTFIHTRPYLDH